MPEVEENFHNTLKRTVLQQHISVEGNEEIEEEIKEEDLDEKFQGGNDEMQIENLNQKQSPPKQIKNNSGGKVDPASNTQPKNGSDKLKLDQEHVLKQYSSDQNKPSVKEDVENQDVNIVQNANKNLQ